jgi:hypothetical protein
VLVPFVVVTAFVGWCQDPGVRERVRAVPSGLAVVGRALWMPEAAPDVDRRCRAVGGGK